MQPDSLLPSHLYAISSFEALRVGFFNVLGDIYFIILLFIFAFQPRRVETRALFWNRSSRFPGDYSLPVLHGCVG